MDKVDYKLLRDMNKENREFFKSTENKNYATVYKRLEVLMYAAIKSMRGNEFNNKGEGLIQASSENATPDKIESFINDLINEHKKQDDEMSDENHNDNTNKSFQDNNEQKDKTNLETEIKTCQKEKHDEIDKKDVISVEKTEKEKE